MKRYAFLLLVLLLILSGCSSTESEILFDEASEGVVSVILQDTNDGTIHYDTIGPMDGENRLRQPTQPFESDPITILTAAENCFENYIENQSPNRLVNISLLDENGNPADVTETIQRILELASGQEHVILNLRILQTAEHSFATVEWNVNFWDPHVLFYYDPNADQLVELYRYDATEVVGLRALNL